MIFSKEYSKLQKDEFTTIRKGSNYYEVGIIYIIKTTSQKFKAIVIDNLPINKKDITEELSRSDADCSREELIAMLERWYGENFDDFVLLTLRKII